ncbi:Rep family protein [Lactococcus cremoris]
MTEKKLEKNDPVRNWSWVVYPESAPENWRTLLDETVLLQSFKSTIK